MLEPLTSGLGTLVPNVVDRVDDATELAEFRHLR
jgi:hypothetical protein